MATSMALASTTTSTEAPTTSSQPDRVDHRLYGVSRPLKRLSLNFHILPPAPQPDHRQSPSSNDTTSAESMRGLPQLPTTSAPLSESNTFLTSLAAQERRVLELREELQKAEADLSRLKNQWAQYEAGRKRNEIRPVQRLQTLPLTPSAVVCSPTEVGTTPAAALRASLENGTDRPVVRKSTQRIFSGSRQTRALSLLSPGASDTQLGKCRFEEALSPTLTTTEIHSKQPPLSGSSTMFSAEEIVGFGHTYKQLAARRSIPPPSKDVLNSGKKMAFDLREGLWTFFEDIRQATVGEEGISGTETRVASTERVKRQCPRIVHEKESARSRARNKEQTERGLQKERAKSMAHRSTKISSHDTKEEISFRKEFGFESLSNKYTDTIDEGTETFLIDTNDCRDAWESPVMPLHPPKQVASIDEKARPRRDGLLWAEVTPSKLSRTVSDLI